MDIQFIGENLLPGKIGQFFIVLSFAASLLSTIAYFFAVKNKDEQDNSWTKLGRVGFLVNLASIIGIGSTLFYLILNHYNEYNYVYSHSSKELPVYYIVSAFWEGQEGSFWLWAFWQSILGTILIWKGKTWENGVMTVIAFSQVFLTSMLLGVEIFGQRIGSSPFILLRDAVDLKSMAPVVFADPENFKNYLKFIVDGKGLNPLLQNYWMVIHPPTLFLGFASMVVPFAYGITALWTRRYKDWVKPVLPWTLFAVMILGTGIIMGSFWAYEALNFGGFWAWDPVENASIIPWLTLIAGVHVLIAYKNTGHAFFTAMALMLMSFILVLYASFLTRSGILGDTSVHSFTDLGMFGHLIAYILAFVIISVYFIATRWNELPITHKDEETYSREFWMFIGALVVTVACLQVIVTTSYPVFNKIFGTSKLISNPIEYYNKWQSGFAFLVTLISGFSQYLKYKRTDPRRFYSSLISSIVFSLVLTALFVYFTKVYTNLMFILLTFSCLFAVLSNARLLTGIFSSKGSKLAGSAIAHIGFAILLLGALVAAATSKVVSINATNQIDVRDFEKNQKPGENIMLYKNEPKKMGKYTVTYVSDTTIAPNTIYTLNFKVIDAAGKVKEEFDVNPNVQQNEKMGLISSPDTKHYLTSDIYTHMTSVKANEEEHGDHEGHAEEENFKAPRIVTLAVGDTIHTSSGVLTVNPINRNPVVKDLKLAAGDLAIGLPLAVNVGGKIYKAEPLFLVKGNNTFDFARNIEELGLRLRFTKVLPDQNKFEVQVYEKPQQAKDWVVFKSIEFPLINLYWVGTIIMVVGFLISIFRRKKELKTS
ncbi:MAG: cytochrome C biogenesis protein [Pedobacter sp.]|nr:MAG: cytochrome C biogenesis protein [Pedobacter sp.]